MEKIDKEERKRGHNKNEKMKRPHIFTGYIYLYSL